MPPPAFWGHGGPTYNRNSRGVIGAAGPQPALPGLFCLHPRARRGGRGLPMKSHRKELWFELPQRRQFVNITGQVEDALRDSGIQDGLCLVNAMHISASVFINDDESGLHADFEKWLEKLAPENPHSQYAHNRGEDNADAHLKR